MGWLLKTKEENEVTKYKIWTTISDGWITEEWMTRDEIIKFLFWNKFYDFMDKFIEESITFPNGYYDKDTHKRNWDDKLNDEHYEFTKSKHGVKGIDYVKLSVNKFSEILNYHGIRVRIDDERGYELDSKENDKEEKKESVSDVITNEPKYLLGVLRNIESNMPKAERKRKSNVSIVKDYLMCHTSKGGRTSSYEMCEYLGIDADAFSFHDNGTLHHVKPNSKK